MAGESRQTAVHSWHESNGAKMVTFAGWHMPLAYPTGAVREHHATRQSAGLFDISHMGRLLVSGVAADTFLDRLISSDVVNLHVGMSCYGLLCNEQGGILDDVFVFRLARERFAVVVNAVNLEKDLTWFRSHQASGVEIRDVTEDTAMFALQGPDAVDTLSSVVNIDVAGLERFGVAERSIGGTRWQISRTGYTGEDGVEIVVPAVDALAVWMALVKPAEVTPAGLAARDSLRFEPGFALYGHEIDENRDPISARLSWACHLERSFIGSEAIEAKKREGVSEKLCTFVMREKGVPRQGCEVVDDDLSVGVVVTGMYAPTVDAFAGNAYLRLEYSSIGSTIAVNIRGRRVQAEVAKRPLYRPAYRG